MVDEKTILNEVRQWIRLGFYLDLDGGIKEWRDRVDGHLTRLAECSRKEPDALDAVGWLQVICLRSEFYDLLGQCKAAAEILEPHTIMGGDQIIDRIDGIPVEPPAAPKKRKKEPAQEEQYARWLRQIAWFHMQFSWVRFFRRGQYDFALDHLAMVERFIETRLIPTGRVCHGTKFRLFYYRAHCERAMRRFPESLISFKKANLHAKLRYEQKRETLKRHIPVERELRNRLVREKRFATICIARILGGGLAWNAMSQGRLTRSQELGLCAETLLMETGHEPLKLFVRSNRAIALRRSAPASTPAAAESMTELLHLFSLYKNIGDVLGQLRCGFEYIRGHIDFLTCWPGKPKDVNKSFNYAKKWLSRLAPLAAEVQDPSWFAQERLLRARLKLAHARLYGSSGRDEQTSDNFPYNTDAEKQIVVVLERMSFPMAPSAVRDSVKILESALEHFETEPDPIIESECRLLHARLLLLSGNRAATVEDLKQWIARSADVENAYLHQTAATIQAELDEQTLPFIIRPDIDDLTWKTWEQQLKSWLSDAARRKVGANASGKAVATVLGIDASSWSRWQKG